MVTPYYEQNGITLYNKDCSCMGEIPDNSVSLIVTSPPYNVGVDYGGYKDDLPYDDYLLFLDKIWAECNRVLLPGGRICIVVGDTGRNPYFPVHCDIASRMRRAGWFLMGIVIWDKQNCLSNTAWGSWQSPSAPSFRGVHEFIIVAGKGGKYYPNKGEPYEWTSKEFLECTLEIWRISPETGCKEHPAPFPEDIPARCIKLFTNKGDIVLDPFAGTSTTLFAANKLGRVAKGYEINAEYCALSAKRLSQSVMDFSEPLTKAL